MSLRAFALAASFALTVPAAAPGLSLPPLADTFATCAGRYAALMEEQWMKGDPASDESETRLEAIRDMLDAVTAKGTRGAVLARENEAKLAFERLLDRAGSEADPRDAEWARERAEAEIAVCAELIL